MIHEQWLQPKILFLLDYNLKIVIYWGINICLKNIKIYWGVYWVEFYMQWQMSKFLVDGMTGKTLVRGRGLGIEFTDVLKKELVQIPQVN